LHDCRVNGLRVGRMSVRAEPNKLMHRCIPILMFMFGTKKCSSRLDVRRGPYPLCSLQLRNRPIHFISKNHKITTQSTLRWSKVTDTHLRSKQSCVQQHPPSIRGPACSVRSRTAHTPFTCMQCCDSVVGFTIHPLTPLFEGCFYGNRLCVAARDSRFSDSRFSGQYAPKQQALYQQNNTKHPSP
jgi:hypothetical protein